MSWYETVIAVHTAVTGTSESTQCHVMRVSMSSALLVWA